MTSPKNFVVYRSSAGSGKTYTLVRDYIRMALSSNTPTGFRHILAITFTNKAAAEMKDRVLKQLAALGENPEHELMGFLTSELKIEVATVQKRAKETLSFMLHNYAELSICTIDKFMHQLVRAFSRDLMLNYDFDVETDRTPLVEESVAKMLEQVGRDAFITEVLVDFVSSQVEDDKSWQIERQLVETSVKTFNPQSEPYLQLLEAFPVEQFADLKKQVNAAIRLFEKEICDIGKSAMALIAKNNLEADAFYYKDRGIYGYFSQLAGGNVLKEANSYVQKTLDTDQFENQNADGAARASVQSLGPQLRQFCEQVEAFREKGLPNYLLGKELMKNLHQLLLLNELHKSLTHLKEEKNLIFVDDFHTLISGVVKNEPAPFIYERIGQRYRHLLIDEFQDTSILQWNNFLPLVTDALATNGNVLLVGDGKQAIYRWRGGEVEQFDHLPAIYPPTDDAVTLEREQLLKLQYRPLELEKNYRSLGQVVQFNNSLYEQLRNHIPDSLASVYANYHQKNTKTEDAGLVTTHFIEAKRKEEAIEMYLDLIEKYIEECLQDGYPQRDICIITRSNKAGKAIVGALNHKKVGGEELEFLSDESLLIATHAIVKLVLSALMHLSDQEHIGYRLDFLLKLIHEIEPSEEHHHSILEKHTHKSGKDGLVTVQLEQYLQHKGFEWNSRQLIQLNLYELAEELARLFRFDGFNTPYWSFFKQQLLNFTNDHGNDLLAFLTWWDKKCDKLSLSIPEDSNAVRITSIHKSKGLQFPVVILPFTDWDFKHRNASYWAEVPEEFSASVANEVPGAMLSGLSSSLECTSLVDQIETENARNLLDNLNLLYVATTRAEERLYLLSKKQSPKSDCSNVAHWLTLHSESQSWSANPMRFGRQCHRSEYFPEKKSAKDQPMAGAIPLSVAGNSGWKEKIRINLEAGALIDGQITTTSRASGNLVHRILAEIETQDDLVEKLGWHQSRGTIDAEQADMIEEQIKGLFEHPIAGKWFDKHEKILIEQAIITPKGATARPDRVMIDGQTATVVDYKTGRPKPEHETQIQQYGQLLSGMNYSCELFLCYLDNAEVKQVAAESQTTLF